MKLYKGYTKEPYSFLVNDTTLSSDNTLQKMSIWYLRENQSNQQQNQAHYNLDRQTSKISALSSGNVVNMDFWPAKMFYLKMTC